MSPLRNERLFEANGVSGSGGTGGGPATSAPPSAPAAGATNGGTSPPPAPAADGADLTTPVAQGAPDLTTPPTAPAQDPKTPGQEKPAGPPVNEFIGAPEGDYEAITLPDGVPADTELMGEFAPVAKELGLSQKGVQKLAEFHLKAQQVNQQRWTSHITALRQQAMSDPEIGGPNYNASLQTAHKAIGAFGDDSFREMLKSYGVGSHPAMIKFCQRVGAAIGETPATTDAGGGGKRDVPLYEILYKDQPK